MSWARTALSFVVFFVAVVALTFVSTFTHEMAHASAWGDAPDIVFAEDRDSATAAIGHEERRTIEGTTYRVMVVDETTVALYPKAILAAGATMGLAPAVLLPDPVLGSTFYALEEEQYADLARGEQVTSWHHSAMPMIVNGILAVPILFWLWKRPGPLSMAAAWVNASEWRFNLHHAAEIGLPAGVYLGIAVGIMFAVAGLMGYVSARGRITVPGTTPTTQ